LKLSKALRKTASLDESLACVLETMFQLFPQAEEGFVMLRDPDTDQLRVRATLVRNKPSDFDVHYSMMIVRTAMQSQQALLSSDAATDIRFRMSESIQQLQIHSLMCAPIVGGGPDGDTEAAEFTNRSFGVIQIGTKQNSKQFSEDDLDILVSVTSQAALAIEHIQFNERLASQQTRARELELATQIQHSFLPRQSLQVSGYDFGSCYKPALNVGGDYYDYIAMPDGRFAVAVADVAGKGVPAALLMARLCSMARFEIAAHESPAKALIAMNENFFANQLTERMVTMVVAVFDPATHQVTIASAGHPPLMLRKADGMVEVLGRRDHGIPLGIVETQEISETTLELASGSSLCLYSDGLTEAMNAERDLFGTARMQQYLEQAEFAMAQELADGLQGHVLEFQGDDVEQHDDICLVCVRRQ
ncbi:SpoIIE family protein phosphatase, partial [bacterium]|nr:SpoIIE family protein phosphatase [bacterium]